MDSDSRKILSKIDQYIADKQKEIVESFCSDREIYVRRFGNIEGARYLRSIIAGAMAEIARDNGNDDDE